MKSPNPFDVEHALILACALAPEASSVVVFAHGTAQANVNWDRLQAIATANGLRPVIARALVHAAGDANAAQDCLAELVATSRSNEGRAKYLLGELLRILGALAEAGIPAIPYKGPMFEHAMHAAPGLREMTDLDLFVRVEHLAVATRVLDRLGYSPTLPVRMLTHPDLSLVTPEWQLMRQADGLVIELHCRLAAAWFPSPCALADIEARQQTLEFVGNSVAWPAAEELLLIHIADGMKSCGVGMKWIGDVARILRRHSNLDWARITTVASRHGGLNVLCVALALVTDCCTDIAASVNVTTLKLDLQPEATALAEEARRNPRLATAVRQIRSAIQNDAELPGAAAQFLWSIRLSDRPARTAGAVIRYLAGPAVTDLAQTPSAGSVLPLPVRAFIRRVRVVAGLRR